MRSKDRHFSAGARNQMQAERREPSGVVSPFTLGDKQTDC
jgi:hypothetical protein